MTATMITDTFMLTNRTSNKTTAVLFMRKKRRGSRRNVLYRNAQMDAGLIFCTQPDPIRVLNNPIQPKQAEQV